MPLDPQQMDWLHQFIIKKPVVAPAATASGAMARQIGDHEKERAADLRDDADALRQAAALLSGEDRKFMSQQADTLDAKAAYLETVYDDEDKRVAFRVDPDDRRIDDGSIVTHYYDDKERAANTLHPNAEGQLVNAKGEVVDGKRIYAMDAETGALIVDEGLGDSYLELVDPDTGKMIARAPNVNKVWNKNTRRLQDWPSDADGNRIERDALPDHLNAGTADFVIGMDEYEKRGVRNARVHHSTMLGDKMKDGHEGAAGAGDVTMKDGKVERITNVSGHYKPEFKHLLQTVEALVAQGAMLDTQLVDSTGAPLDDETQDLYKRMSVGADEIAKGVEVLEKSLGALGEGQEADQARSAIERGFEALFEKAKQIEAANDLLREIGAGPRNALTGEVAFNDFEGADVRARGGKKTTMSTKEFLMGKSTADPIDKAGHRVDAGRAAVMADLRRAADEQGGPIAPAAQGVRAQQPDWTARRDAALAGFNALGLPQAPDAAPTAKEPSWTRKPDDSTGQDDAAPPVEDPPINIADQEYSVAPVEAEPGNSSNQDYAAPPVEGPPINIADQEYSVAPETGDRLNQRPDDADAYGTVPSETGGNTAAADEYGSVPRGIDNTTDADKDANTVNRPR